MKTHKKYNVEEGNGGYMITATEKRGSYIVATTFDNDKKALRYAKNIASLLNKAL